MDDRPHVPEGSRTRELRTADGLREFAAASLDLACILGRQGTITSVNPACTRVLGWSRRELVGRSVFELTHEDDRQRMRSALERVLAGEVLPDLASRWPHVDGSWRWISWSATLGPDRNLVYAAGRDLTDRVELQLRTARDAVELQVALATERETTALLQRAEERKDAFLTAAAHDLRAPLSIAQGAAETLTRLRGSLPPVEVAQLEQLIVTQLARLSRTLDGLLDPRRLAAHTYDRLAAVDLVELVGSVVAESPVAERTSIAASSHLTLTADPVQIEHIVVNLLENAAKYAPAGPVLVTLDGDEDTVRLSVRDQGPGIPSAALEQVFEASWRGATADGTPGTGMGLALVAEFARLHGGNAWAEPTSRGAHLVVELPRRSSS